MQSRIARQRIITMKDALNADTVLMLALLLKAALLLALFATGHMA